MAGIVPPRLSAARRDDLGTADLHAFAVCIAPIAVDHVCSRVRCREPQQRGARCEQREKSLAHCCDLPELCPAHLESRADSRAAACRPEHRGDLARGSELLPHYPLALPLAAYSPHRACCLPIPAENPRRAPPGQTQRNWRSEGGDRRECPGKRVTSALCRGERYL